MLNNEIIPIVFSTDHNFIMPTGVAILSLMEHSYDCCPHIYILQSNNVTDKDRAILESIGNRYSASVNFISIGDTFNNCFEIRGITTATYYRLMIPWLIPEYDKILYCDGDIVFNKSVSNIYAFPVDDYYVAGVQTGFRRHTNTGAHIESLGLDVSQYVNGGVLLINSKKHRELKLKEVYMTQAKNKYKFQDQDIINIVCKGHIALMPRSFNVTPNAVNEFIFFNGNQENGQALINQHEEPVIIHYSGEKPWKEFTYWWLSWWKAYSRSPFYDSKLEFHIERKTLTRELQLKRAFLVFIKQRFPIVKKLIKKIR